MELIETFLRKLTFVVLSIVTVYGRVTEGSPLLLGIVAPAATIAGLGYFGPVWLAKVLMGLTILFAVAFILAMAFMHERFIAHESE